MKKNIFLLILFAVIGFFLFKNTNPMKQANKDGPTKANQDLNEEIKPYLLSDVAEHSNPEDCWLTIENTVYDVTSYISGGLHPGGEAILSGCGKDATEMFGNRPGGKGPHPKFVKALLSKYEIGELKQ